MATDTLVLACDVIGRYYLDAVYYIITVNGSEGRSGVCPLPQYAQLLLSTSTKTSLNVCRRLGLWRIQLW